MTDKWKKVDGSTWEKWKKVDDEPDIIADAIIWFIIAACAGGCF